MGVRVEGCPASQLPLGMRARGWGYVVSSAACGVGVLVAKVDRGGRRQEEKG